MESHRECGVVLLGGVGGVVRLEPTTTCSGEITARTMPKRRALIRVRRVFVVIWTTHYLGKTMQLVAKKLGESHTLSRWPLRPGHKRYGIARQADSGLDVSGRSEGRRSGVKWPTVVPAVQWAPKTAFC